MSPELSIRTFLSIWRTISSMCLSWISTPWLLYTSCTSPTRYRAVSVSSRRSRSSVGASGPSLSGVPASIDSPSATRRRVRRGNEYSSASSSPDGVTETIQPRSPSAILTRPAISESVAAALGLRASKSSTTRGRPCVMSSPATPPVWNVRIVSCVPGSPIDCAATVPTASPSSLILPVAIDQP